MPNVIPARLRSLIAPAAQRSAPERILHSEHKPSFIAINKQNLHIGNGASVHLVSNEADITVDDGKLFVEFIPANGSVTIDMTALGQPEVIMRGDHHLKRYHGLAVHGHPGHIFNIRSERPQKYLTIHDSNNLDALNLEMWEMRNYLGDNGIALFENLKGKRYFRNAFIPDHISMVVRWQLGRALSSPRHDKELVRKQYPQLWKMYMANEAAKMIFSLTKNAQMTPEVVNFVHELFDSQFALNIGSEDKPEIIKLDLRKYKPEELQLLPIPVKERELVELQAASD